MFRNVCGKTLKTITLYFPEFASFVANPDFVDEFTEGVRELYPTLLAAELEPAIKSQMRRYKFHTMPRLNDIFDMLSNYMEQRIDLKEKYLQNTKQKHLKADTEELPNVDYSALKMRLRQEMEQKKPKREQITRDQERIQTHDPDLTFEKWMEQQKENEKP